MWRFDQGRLEYFQLDEVRRLAKGLLTLDGQAQPSSENIDIVRKALNSVSNKDFLPFHYQVWRNYGRVFETLLLATVKNKFILSTDLCKRMAEDEDFDPDDYLAYFAGNFYYPSPIFKDYDPNKTQVFPVVAIIKFLFSEYLTKGKANISIEDIFNYLIGNNVTGEENLIFYGGLRNVNAYSLADQDSIRQVRELVRFISQFSFLKWERPYLHLEQKSPEDIRAIEQLLKPVKNIRKADPAEELLQMGGGRIQNGVGSLTMAEMSSSEEEFTEGKKIRVTHLRTERSTRLKSAYFRTTSQPTVCRMCNTDTVAKYPWTKHVIELHHLLPLSSPVRVENLKTSLSDLVGLCPSCHRATHRYHSIWFRSNGVNDFGSHAQAKMVYEEVKMKVVINRWTI